MITGIDWAVGGSLPSWKLTAVRVCGGVCVGGRGQSAWPYWLRRLHLAGPAVHRQHRRPGRLQLAGQVDWPAPQSGGERQRQAVKGNERAVKGQ